MNIHPPSGRRSIGSSLADFEPDFDFVAPPPLPVEEFEERLRRIRREAVVAGHDALHRPHRHRRLVPHLERLSPLHLRLDARRRADHSDRRRTRRWCFLSFFTQSVLLPPGGEPVLVDDIRQIGPIGREYADRPGSSRRQDGRDLRRDPGRNGSGRAVRSDASATARPPRSGPGSTPSAASEVRPRQRHHRPHAKAAHAARDRHVPRGGRSWSASARRRPITSRGPA